MYFPVLSTLTTLSLLSLTSARSLPRAPNSKISVRSAVPSRPRSIPVVTDNVLELTKKSTGGSKVRSAARFLKNLDIVNGSSTALISLFEGEEFATDITFGTQTFEVIVDTGSSDTWLAETGFSCVNLDTGKSASEATCAFGPTYTKDSTFKAISGEEFSITYGDGEYLTGVLGSQPVTFAGINVTTTVALVTSAAWEGDGTTSGLVGMAYPGITSAYKGSTQVVYNPIFTTMYEEELVDSLFSLAIERDVSGPAGYLALGGVPPVDFVQDFASTPILVTSITGYPKTYDFYTIKIQAAYLNGKAISGAATPQYIVDSGTTLNYLPTTMANAINKAFVPAAVYSNDEGAYVVSCTAVPPVFGIEIGGTVFYTNPLDMILYAGTDDDGNDVCISGIDDGGSDTADDLYILGDTFQKNVVTVFDVGAGVLQFAARENYTSNDTY
ncbi:putative aspartic-type protein [Botrytis fragariae]|uniref:Putative aspartic-type protein n=1 Tax=Botrytis fragariae TaxID=1964551 RepID=A0A8H6AQS8_9HELO|nr:putative aspartic-type protein [Botrytis fragariae]KAF5871887.1 putative aspartic-type protein [Botrytis fragariae]